MANTKKKTQSIEQMTDLLFKVLIAEGFTEPELVMSAVIILDRTINHINNKEKYTEKEKPNLRIVSSDLDVKAL